MYQLLGPIHVDEETFNLEYIHGFGYKYPPRAPRNIQDHISIEETINGEKKTKLTDNGSLDIDFLYNQGIYQSMIVNSSYEMKNLMTNENIRHEEWMNDYLVSTDSRMDSQTIKVYPKKPNSNDYADQPIFNKTFDKMNVYFIGKKGDLCYVHEEQKDRGLLLVFDITTNEIVTKYETPKIFGPYDFNMDDLENVVEIMQQKDCNKYGYRDFHKALSKYLTCKYNMNTPSKKLPLRGG